MDQWAHVFSSFRLAIVAALCLVTSTATAEPVAVEITPPQLRPGDTFVLRRTTGDPSLDEDPETRDALAATSTLRIRVLHPTDAGVLVEARISETTIASERPEPDSELAPLVKIAEAMAIQFELAPTFRPGHVSNAAELREQTRALMVEARQFLGIPEDDPKFDRIVEVFTSDTALASIISQDIQPYFLPYFYLPAPARERELEVKLNNPFGGDPVPAVATARFEPIPDDPERVRFHWQQILTHEAREQIGAELRKQRPDIFVDGEAEGPPSKRSDSATAVLNLRTGLIENITHTTDQRIGERRESIRRTWTLVELERAAP